jgi:hypothetical protein
LLLVGAVLATSSVTQSQTHTGASADVGHLVAHAGEWAPNLNPFQAAKRGDALAEALARLAHTAIDADLGEAEPWLFDRATAFYKLALYTRDDELKRHAFALVERYYSLVDANGEFTLKPGDAKYAYTDGAVWYEHETAKPTFRAQAKAVYELWLREWPRSYSPSQGFWTEREIAFALAAALGWYELSGDAAALARARELVTQWGTMAQDSGAPLHTLRQHQEEFEPPYAARRMTSPWMAALFLEHLQTYERLTGDRHALELISAYADFMLANCLYDGSVNHPNLKGYLMGYYLCGEDGTYYDRETPSEADGEHSPDLMGIMAAAVDAKRRLGLDAEAALHAYTELRRSAEHFVGRRLDVDPPRKINWWIGTSYDSDRLVE